MICFRLLDRWRRTLAAGCAVALVVGPGCGRSDPKGREAGQDASASRPPHGEPALCDPAAPLIEVGPIHAGGEDATDARATGRITLVRSGECARVRLDLLADAAGGAPAERPGAMRGALLRDLGVVRFPLARAIESVGDPDTTIEGGDPLRAAYVVRARDGSFYFDVHLKAAAVVLAMALPGPARLLVEARPGGGAVPVPPAAARNVVVLEPRPGAAVYPLVIRGYARTFEANVIARLSVEGAVVATTFGTAADGSTTWGEFELRIPGGPAGPLELFVGEDDAESGGERGVRISLVLP